MRGRTKREERFVWHVNKMMPTLYPLASLAQIENSPSRDDGIPPHLEEDLRAYGCKLMHQAGILLKQYVSRSSVLHLIQELEQEAGCGGSSTDSLSEILVC